MASTNARGQRHSSGTDPWLTPVLLVIAGIACLALAVYAAVSLKAAALVGTLAVLGVAVFVLAAFSQRLTGKQKLGPSGLEMNLRDLPAAPDLPKETTAQVSNADAAMGLSFVMDLLHMLSQPNPVAFAVVDLGTGHEWLSSRLLILAALLERTRGAQRVVFLDTRDGLSDHYVGIAEIRAVRWGLARQYPFLEAALTAALARAFRAWWPLKSAGWFDLPIRPPSVVDANEVLQPLGLNPAYIRSLSGGLDPPGLTETVLLEYLAALTIQQPPPDQPPPGWVRLRSSAMSGKQPYWECASWIDSERLHNILGPALVSDAVHESPNGAVELDPVLVWDGPVVPVIDERDGFVRGIDRAATVHAQMAGELPARPPRRSGRSRKP